MEQSLLEILNSVGFPIVACIALFKMNRDQANYYKEMLTEFRITIEKNTDAINNLTREVDKRWDIISVKKTLT